MNFINFLIVKMLVKIKFANIVNIAAKEEIIPELLQSKCNSQNIFKHVSSYIDNPNKIKEQLKKIELILDKLKISESPAKKASMALLRHL